MPIPDETLRFFRMVAPATHANYTPPATRTLIRGLLKNLPLQPGARGARYCGRKNSFKTYRTWNRARGILLLTETANSQNFTPPDQDCL